MSKTTLYFKEEVDNINGEDEVREYSIIKNEIDHTLPSFINNFIRPLLLSIGYLEKTVEECIGEYYWDED
jgi:hypothetical protein